MHLNQKLASERWCQIILVSLGKSLARTKYFAVVENPIYDTVYAVDNIDCIRHLYCKNELFVSYVGFDPSYIKNLC